MADLFARASLSYLCRRCDEGFESIYSYLVKTRGNEKIQMNEEEQEVFCLVSMSIVEERYQSWIHLNRLLTETDSVAKRHSITIYQDLILDELNVLSEKIFHLIERYLNSRSNVFFLKMQGDIHFLVCQTSKSDKKIEHFLSALTFYNEALERCPNTLDSPLVQVTYNKALVRTSDE